MEEKILKALESFRLEVIGGFNRVEDRLDKLEGCMDKLECRMDRLEGRMDKLEGHMDKLEYRMDKLETSMDKLELRVGALESQVNENTQILKALEHSAAVNKAEHDSMMNDLVHLKGDTTAIRTDLSNVEKVTSKNVYDITLLKLAK